ncbi:MAG: DNA mismatch repair protein MutT [Acidimicrobiia bacterium]|nr:MAG: DNA mismatch repair protein MutT [Acidimicrobiia bacterium]
MTGDGPAGRLVRAAGGVVVRHTPGGTEVLVVHRPRYDDWSLPKGKVDPGEDEEDAARREVAEETGWLTEHGREVATVEYTDRHGRPKRVRYWEMTPVRFAGFTPGDEVDEVRWVPIGAAGALLSYDSDRAVLDRYLTLRRGDGT